MFRQGYEHKMDSTKRLKLSEIHTQDFTTLITICTRFPEDKVAIEYYDENDIKIEITYQNLEMTLKKVKKVLETITDSQFVALDLELQSYCIPALMLGIISSGRGFVNISLLTSKDVCSRLKVLYLFSQSSVPNTDLMHQFNIHGQIVQLFKFKTSQGHSTVDFEKNCFAYAINTSGTTGVPKIVRVPHKCIVPNILDLRNIFSIVGQDKIAQLTSLTFDPSIVEIFLGLSNSCTLFMASAELKKNSKKLLEIMNLSKTTVLQTTPSLLFGKFSKIDLKMKVLGEESSFRILSLGGEPFPRMEALMSIKHKKNQTKIFNIYGITEVSCWASVEEFKAKRTFDISNGFLGNPLSQTLFEVRNEEGELVEEGEGILFIGSDKRICVVDDEKINTNTTVPIFRNTGDKVMIDSAKQIFYKGRHNKIIKRFGNRVDLTALENSILKMDSIQNCHAIWNEKSHKLFVCVSKVTYLKEEDKNVKIDIMNQLQNLPSYYSPDEIYLIDNLPLTLNGKICFQSLRKMCSEKQSSVKYSLESMQRSFQTLWQLSAGSLENGFLKSGGNSVTALQIVNTLSEKFGKEFPDLIAMLMKDANFTQCFSYVKRQIKSELNSESVINSKCEMMELSHSTSSSSYKFAIDKKVEKDNVVNFEEKKFETCLWQKCRGFRSEKDNTENHIGIALNKEVTFQILERFDLRKCVDASPTVYEYSNGKLFVTVGSHAGVIVTVEINSANNYFIELPDRIEASVLIFDHFRGVVGCYDGNVYCLNLKSGEIFWKFQTGDAVKCTAATCSEQKYVFVGSYDRHMYCLSLETGLELWKMKASEGSISATPRLHFETKSLLFGTLDGTCVSLDQVSGEIKWRHFFSDPIFSAVAILETGNVIVASVSGILASFHIQTGQKLWTYNINGNIFSHLVTVKSSVSKYESIIFTSRNKTLYHLDCNLKPVLKYSTTTESPIIATPWHTGEIILNACINGTLQIIDSNSGEILMSHKLSGEIFSSPVLHQDLIVVGCRDNQLYVLKLIA